MIGTRTWSLEYSDECFRNVVLTSFRKAVNMDRELQDFELTLSGRDNCQVIIAGAQGIGEMRLWVPEAIVSNTGASSVYPKGKHWVSLGSSLIQHVSEQQLIGGGNCPLVNESTFECCGFRFPLDSPVRWMTVVESTGCIIFFCIRLSNVGNTTIQKAGAAVCLKFNDADWWDDKYVRVLSDNCERSLAELGRGAGLDDVFEAYLLKDEAYDHPFYQGFWGFNEHRLDAPFMQTINPASGVSVTILGERAYFLHSNRDNPCTDIMLAFGDLMPGMTSEARGMLLVRKLT